MLGWTLKIRYDAVESFCAVTMLASSVIATKNKPTALTTTKRALFAFIEYLADLKSKIVLVANEPAAKLKKGRDW
jgi:hypothetical protein